MYPQKVASSTSCEGSVGKHDVSVSYFDEQPIVRLLAWIYESW